MRAAALLAAMLIGGCSDTAPKADMPARSWQYFVAHPAEIEPMQKICRDWAGSSAPATSQLQIAR